MIASRDPALNDRYAALHARTLDHFTEVIATVLARGGVAPAYSPRAFAELILAIDTGRVLEMATGKAELKVEQFIDLLGRALVPLAATEEYRLGHSTSRRARCPPRRHRSTRSRHFVTDSRRHCWQRTPS